MIGTVDGRRLVVTTEEDGKNLDSTAEHILISLCKIFPNVPTEYAACCFRDVYCVIVAFSALMLLVGQKERHLGSGL